MQAPKIDKRDSGDIIKQLGEMAAFYTPEWRFSEEDKDAGTALVKIFAGMFEGIIKRLNQVPENNFIAFLNMLGTKLLPAWPARAPVTFKLSTGASQPVLIKAGTRLAANPAEGGDPLVFETESTILAMPAKLVDAYSVSKNLNYISRMPSEYFAFDIKRINAGSAAKLFDFSDTRENKQQHILYLGDASVFNIKEVSQIKLVSSGFKQSLTALARGNAPGKLVTWEYLCGEATDAKGKAAADWCPLDMTLAADDSILLQRTTQHGEKEIKEYEIGKIKSRWIRCRIDTSKALLLKDLEAGSFKVPGDSPVFSGKPDHAACNYIPLDLSKDGDILPFGKYPQMYSAFYFASSDAFSKKGALTVFSFKTTVNDPKITITTTLSWEYWNGTGWTKLPLSSSKIDFNTKNYVNEIKYICPNDMAKTTLCGQTSYWIRAQIIEGCFSAETKGVVEITSTESTQGSSTAKTTIQKVNTQVTTYTWPVINTLRIDSRFTDGKGLEACLLYNNLEYAVQKDDGQKFKPFSTLRDSHPAFYLGFDRAIPPGPASIFFSIGDQAYKESNRPRIKWEYYSDAGQWESLQVTSDGTNSLIRSGTLVFTGSQDFAACTLFGQKLYWVRAVDTEDIFERSEDTPPAPIIKGIYFNTVWASNYETVSDEVIGSSDGSQRQVFSLSKTPIASEEIWVDEMSSLTESERKALASSGMEVQEVKNRSGETREFWVKWESVDELLSCGPSSRCYAIDRTLGTVQFGDGINGAIPPIGSAGIKAHYKAGGGARGNVDIGGIKDLSSSIAFIEGVVNPEAAAGGYNLEDTASAIERGPQVIRHRNRAVTVKDFEWLGREASRSIARIKCLPGFKDGEPGNTGWATVLVVPRSGEARPAPSPELKARVENYLRACSANTLISANKLQVAGPDYIELSIRATLIAGNIEAMPLVERAAENSLSAFLHPLTGGYEQKGWEFGRLPHLSDFYYLLEGLDGVDYVAELTLIINDTVRKEVREITANSAFDNKEFEVRPNFLVFSGKHSITVNI